MVNTLFNSSKKNHNKKSLEGRFQRKLQTAISGTEHTVTTDTGKKNPPKFYFGTDYISERQEGNTEDRRQHQPKKPTLPEGGRWKIHPVERNPQRCIKRKAENCTKSTGRIRL